MLNGKVVVITGAGRGIGASMARLLNGLSVTKNSEMHIQPT